MSTPFKAYQGSKPFLFVTYAHKDKSTVYPIINKLHQSGYRIWYDEGIPPAAEWPTEIQEAIEQSCFLIVFVSPNAVESINVRKEITFAISEKKAILPILLQETELKYGLGLQLKSIQAIIKYRLSESKFVNKLMQTLPPSTKRNDVRESAKSVDLVSCDSYKIEEIDVSNSFIQSERFRRPILLPNGLPFLLKIFNNNNSEIFSLNDHTSAVVMKLCPNSTDSRIYPKFIQGIPKQINFSTLDKMRLRILPYVINKMSLYPKGHLEVIGELQTSDSAEFDLFNVSKVISNYILFYYRLMLFKNWEGIFCIQLSVQSVGRKHLQVKAGDNYRELDPIYRLPGNETGIEFAYQGYIVNQNKGILTVNHPIFMFISKMIERIALSFGFTTIRDDILSYTQELLISLAKYPGDFNKKDHDNGVTLKRLYVPR